MGDAFSRLYLTEEERKPLFRSADVIFDSSALLDLYQYSDSAKEEIMEIFNKLSENGRLWIPHQVDLEYHSNREDAAKKPIRLYRALIDQMHEKKGRYIENMIASSKLLSEEYKKAQEAFDNIIEQTKFSDRKKHPYIDTSFFDDMKTVSECQGNKCCFLPVYSYAS